MKKYFILMLLLMTASCANHYKNFYKPMLKASDQNNPRLIYNVSDPEIVDIPSASIDDSIIKQIESGFILQGVSSFNGPLASKNDLIAEAKELKSYKVLRTVEYSNTVQGAMPITLPDQQTTYYNGSVYGNSYSGNYYGTSTTYGTKTTYIPYSVDKYNQVAIFFVKRTPGGWGVYLRDTSLDQKQKLGSNKGAAVIAVVTGGSVWRSDIISGDIITKIDEIEVISSQEAYKLMGNYYGKNVDVEIYRNGLRKIVKVQVDSQYLADE